MKNQKTFKFPWRFFGKAILITFSLSYLTLLIIALLLGWLFDAFLTCLDAKVLSEEQTQTRKTDRFAKRFDNFLNNLIDYWKLIIS